MWKRLTDAGPQERTLELLLRLGVAGCYIGHGAFGLITKEAWLPYFGVAGIGPDVAWTLMPIVGSIDVLVGILALIVPLPAVLGYAAVWGVWTAMLRPLSGESVFELFERAGNFGVPIALLVLAGTRWRPTMDWLRTIEIPPLTPRRRRLLIVVLQATTVTLLAGHGALAFLGKPLLAGHLAAIGLPEGSAALMGVFELLLAAAIALRPSAGLLLTALAWKVATELLYPLTGAPFWEFVERAGSYVAPLALWTMVRAPVRAKAKPRARAGAPSTVAAFLTAVAGLTASAMIAVAADAPRLVPTLDLGSRGPAEAQEASLLARLRAGGLVLACRHAHTDRSRGDRRPVDFDDPGTQRVLSERGKREARELGEVLRRQRIPIGEVFASPYARAMETAELAFGRATAEDGLYRDPGTNPERVRQLFAGEPEPGTNRVLVSHQWVLYPAMPTVERGSIPEGDCVVLDPDGESFEVVARVGAEEFAALVPDEAEPTTPEGRAIAAAIAGGTNIVCRHAATGSFREMEPVDYADSTSQRLLSPEGERQSRELGRALVGVGVDVTELIASPMNRARRTALLMFGREPVIEEVWHTNGGSYEGGARAARRHVLRSRPARGNRLIVSHIGTMESVLDGLDDVGEGDCVVVRAQDGAYEVVGVVAPDRWTSGGGT